VADIPSTTMATGPMDPYEFLIDLADGLDAATRQGSDADSPEGMRYIVLSDTLAKLISLQLRETVELFKNEWGGP
jgi:hypothetical protein